MPDASYDAVIIGAGHNGLCLAAYLARAGMKVGMFERRHDEGGGAHTDEATVPGFWHNLHAQYMEFIDMMPFYRDFDLPSFGARMIKPDAQVGITFADGQAAARHLSAGTCGENLSRVSPTTRSTMRTTFTRSAARCSPRTTTSRRCCTALLPNEVPADAGRTETIVGHLLQLWVDLGFKPNEMNKSPKVLIDEVFESSEMRATLYRQCVEWGANLHSGDGFGFVMAVIWLCGNHYMSVGGTHTLAHAMASAALAAGADLRYNSPVVEIMQPRRTRDRRAAQGRPHDRGAQAGRLQRRSADYFRRSDRMGRSSASFRKERMSNWRFGPEHVLGTPSFALRAAARLQIGAPQSRHQQVLLYHRRIRESSSRCRNTSCKRTAVRFPIVPGPAPG